MVTDITAGKARSGAIGEAKEKLPLAGLLALAVTAFITLLTEIMPAGLLSSIATGLNVSESLAGQFITAYAIGALVAAIPVTTLTQGVRRRPLLLVAIGGFAVVNLVTALSDDYTVSLVARFFAGMFGGIVWSLLAGYAVRMSPAQGRFALIDDPAVLDVNPFKRKSVSTHWEFMFTRSMFGTADIAAQGLLLAKVAHLVDAGAISTTRTATFGTINAANLKRAHALIESGRTRGKIVLEGFDA